MAPAPQEHGEGIQLNRPKTLDNRDVRAFLEDFYCASDACECCPELDDIFSGVLALKTAGDTSTRSLSRQVLFHVLQWCDSIDVASISEATQATYAPRTMERYAAVARVASRAIRRVILKGTTRRDSAGLARRELDAEFALPAGLV